MTTQAKPKPKRDWIAVTTIWPSSPGNPVSAEVQLVTSDRAQDIIDQAVTDGFIPIITVMVR